MDAYPFDVTPYPLCFFFNDTATTEIYTLSLHDALPISGTVGNWLTHVLNLVTGRIDRPGDRKSTRLNSSHTVISYAVFCLKTKTKPDQDSRGTGTRKRLRSRTSRRPGP